ncbi:hypothetical protein SAY87_030330 [Trapa incisa]|uniref:DUF4378 domain-containing protein n=1 Tax=Trapa incisa TaxID=236973 RepID=A0AAN7KIE9_9MYRT|nr:hypothetical protein SAY87_030330 [Trapa incisa]
MTKPAQRRSLGYDQSGCMGGLISLLDFRHGSKSPRKLLADKRRASRQTIDSEGLGGKSELSIDIKENHLAKLVEERSSKMTAADAPDDKPSVKTLIEEEMVCVKGARKDPKLPPEQHEDRKKRWKRRTRNSRGSLEMEVSDLSSGHESLTSSKCPCNHSSDKGSFDKQNKDDIILEEVRNHITQRGISEVCLELKPNNSDLGVKEKLHEAIKELISREVVKENNLQENEGVKFSKEMVDALQIPNLKEESFMKILPNSSMENAGTVNSLDKDDKPKDSVELKGRKFFRRHSKSKETKVLKEEQKGPNCASIVVLKPRLDSPSDSSQAQTAERAKAYFFLSKIKRRWKNMMGKEQNPNIVVRKSSSRFNGENLELKSPSKDHFFIEKIAKPRDAGVNNKSESVSSSKQRVPNIYVEARRHLSNMLISGNEEAGSFGAKSPKTLARILALSEFSSPIPSPRMNSEQRISMTRMRSFEHKNDQSEKVSEIEERVIVQGNGSHLNWSAKGVETELSDTVSHNVEIGEAYSAAREDMMADVNTTILISSDVAAVGEDGGYAPSELICMPADECDELIHSPEIPNRDMDLQMAEEEGVRDSQPPPTCFESPPSSYTVKALEASKALADIPERPSPVSVLESLFMEEDTISAKTGSLSGGLSIEPLKINFKDDDNLTCPELCNLSKNHSESAEEETLLLYVTSVLQALGLNWTELYLKSQLSDQLLEPSLYGEVDFFCDHPQFNQNLVFDCINESLLEVIDHHFRLWPRVSFTKPMIRAIPSLKDAILEVWERVTWHLLLPMPQPRTLEQVVRKDMARNESWMDLRADSEGLGFDMSDEILDDLMEELSDESLHSLYASSSTGVIENEDNIGS